MKGVCILASYGPRWGVSLLINHSPGKHLNQKVCRQNSWVVSDNKNCLFMRTRFIIHRRRCLHEKQNYTVKTGYNGTARDRNLSVEGRFSLIQVLENWILRTPDPRNCKLVRQRQVYLMPRSRLRQVLLYLLQ
jgi:hypothetical protein